MMKQVTDEELEDSVVRMCAPTLLGVKPANMFTFSGRFSDDEVQAPSANAFEDARVWCRAAGCEEPLSRARADGCAESWSQPHAADDEHGCTDQRCPCTITGRRREELGLLVHRLDRELGPYGVRVRVIAWRAFGAIVLAYRPDLLVSHLRDARTTAVLASLGYPVLNSVLPDRVRETSLDALLAHLTQRFAMEKLPHEIGFFLGYPYEDVEGFVRHRGRKFRFCGCWKVYGDPRAAAKLFARYRRCTRRCVRLRRSGSKVVDIAAGCRYRGRGGA
ncbi:MAG: DUF3793 family protein [Enorma sp.]|uniref:DUF3793 family protein n=1 Tax=Enorma sp. TaxID=1920692 RepID=UPI00258B262B|nr:DUF3793 family protein [Enorma sp.]MCI7774324.1 DUF3793 family protein [Enorma sp.]